MAFLGSLGKSLGLDTDFGKGLIGGIAKSAAEGIREDRKSTQDNIDNLVIETYKGAVESKKDFDKMYKENKKVIENIAANMGGDEGINHPDALRAAQTLINQQGLDGAFELAQKYNKIYQHRGVHPTKSLLGDQTGKSAPISLSALTKSTITPIAIPDPSQLGEATAVGLMKLPFFGGAKRASKDINDRAMALLEARGIDINEQTIDVPPALKGNIDPVMLGMRDNPTEEKARLLAMRTMAERNGTLTPKLEASINNHLDMNAELLRSLKKGKGLDISGVEKSTAYIKGALHDKYALPANRNTFGVYIGSGAKLDQQKILNEAANYYIQFINRNAEAGDLDMFGKNNLEINKAITNNLNLTGAMINGVYTIQADEASEHLDSAAQLILNPKGKKTPDPKKVLENKKTSNLSTNQIIGEVKNILNRKDLTRKEKVRKRIALEKEFINKYMEDNPGADDTIALQEFKKQIVG